jgi:uncharacterized protein
VSDRILVDTGPLVALLHRKDASHRICTKAAKKIRADLVTCWPVITEAAWILRAYSPAIQRLLQSIHQGVLRVLDLDAPAAGWIADFMKRHETLGAQLADASLVYLAEREGLETVFTLDRRDFSVYRLGDGRALHLLPEG